MLLTLFKMTRPINIAIAIITLAVGYFLLGAIPYKTEGITTFSFILQCFGFAFAIAFANIQNDILDFESDKLNQPQRAIVSGKISLKAANRIWKFFFLATIACGFIESVSLKFDFTSVLFFLLLALLLIAYNKKLKHIPLLKNMTVAFLCATPLLLNLFYPLGLYESDINSLDFTLKLGILYPAIIFAFLLTTVREIYKDLEDEIGDLKAGIMTFPLIAGSKTALKFANALLLFTWIILPLPVIQGFYPPIFIILTALFLTPCFAYIVVQASYKKNYKKAQKTTKISMLIGLISLIISVCI